MEKKAREARSPSVSSIQSSGSQAINGLDKNQPPDTQPATGTLNAQVVGIFHEGRGMTTPTGFQYVESADLLLSDGWEYSGLTGPPEDMNIEASKRTESQKWHRWRQQGGDIYVENNGRWSKLNGDMVRPLEANTMLSKSLVHRNAYTFIGMGSSVSTDRIAFYRDGRFERSGNVLAGSGSVQAAGGFSAGASSVTSRNGTTSSSHGTYSGNGGSVTVQSSSARRDASTATGTYRVRGYTLELDCADGQVQRLLAFYPFPGKPQVFIGNVTFSVE